MRNVIIKTAALLILLTLIIPYTASAAVIYKEGSEITFHNNSAWYIIDDKWIEGKYPAERINLVLYVSLTDFSDAFKCFTYYNPDDNSVYVKFSEKEIWQGIGYRNMYINNVLYDNPEPYVSEESGAVMVPLEPYASVIGYNGVFEVLDTYVPGQMTLHRASTPYTITSLEVNKAAQLITVYGKSPSGNVEPVKYMLCSTGLNNSTPSGTFRISPLGGQWYYFAKFNCYVLYCSQIVGDVCFHSIPHNGYSYSSMSEAGYAAIGNPASHGCIRVLAEDAKFIHQNCGSLPVNIIGGYSNDTTSAIKSQLLSSKPTYSEYVAKLQSGNF